jgi:3-dehydroquinate synthase
MSTTPQGWIVPCAAGLRGYDIHVTAGGLDGLGAIAREFRGIPSAVITDANVEPLYGPAVSRILDQESVPHTRLIVPPGEGTKSYARLVGLLDDLIAAGVSRDGMVLALGGGVVGDLAGLAASLLRRGVACVQVPTTLVAQVDAAIGGKTAINTEHGKNLVGTFHQPTAVFASARCLETLPLDELRAGMAEVVKYALLDGPDLLDEVEASVEAVLARDFDALASLVHRGARIKARIVEEDERESGHRRWLNLGHTVGHAVERACGYGVMRHGEAVSIGLVAACELSLDQGWLSAGDVERTRRILEALGLPVCSPPIHRERTWAALRQDKKSKSDGLRWVFLRGVGEPFVRRESLDGSREFLAHLGRRGVLHWS